MKFSIAVVLLLIFIYANNASWVRAIPDRELSLLAHRGVHQTYSKQGLTKMACTANRIDAPEHQYLENTMESIKHSFNLGADIVEIDIHPTTDGHFAVFHDWTLACRTDGKGKVRSHSLAYLQSLDIGYGYTHDDGRSFPFRGKGIGKMPSLTQVLDEFSERRFLINIKSNSLDEADLISAFLDKRDNENLSRLWFYGAEQPMLRLLSLNDELKGFTKSSVKACAINYQLLGWSGYMPEACKNTVIALPKSYAPYFWGWPRRFVNRMDSVNTHVILIDTSYGHTDGIDDPDEIKALSKDFRGIIWTDKIEQVTSFR